MKPKKREAKADYPTDNVTITFHVPNKGKFKVYCLEDMPPNNLS